MKMYQEQYFEMFREFLENNWNVTDWFVKLILFQLSLEIALFQLLQMQKHLK